MTLQIATVPVTSLQQNCRILWKQGSINAVVVDPGGQADRISAELSRLGLECSEIWLTHSHLDHCGGVKELKAASGAPLLAHPNEQLYRERVKEVSAMYGLSGEGMENCPEPETVICGGETLSFDSLAFDVLFTPGHSPGHLCFYHRDSDTLIAGDTVFAGSIGRTDLPGGDHGTLMKSIQEMILPLPDETKILPGHGPDTTVGRERVSNPFLTGGA